jgi:putative resolvase
MKSKEVLDLLEISRVTLWTYVKNGKIKATKRHNGFYDYDNKSVYELLNSSVKKNVIYTRVSTYKQKKDLTRQIEKIKDYCSKNNINIDGLFSEVHSGIDMDRPEFTKLMNSVLKYEIDTIYITNKDRLTRLSFITLESIFNKFGTKIIVINKKESKDDNDIFEELISMMHYFSTKMYSNRRKKKIDIIQQDIKLEIENKK